MPPPAYGPKGSRFADNTADSDGKLHKSESNGSLSSTTELQHLHPETPTCSFDSESGAGHSASFAPRTNINDAASGGTRAPRKKGVAWTEEEHRQFLLGLQKLGKGDWRGISWHFVRTRTPTQVASHAQKYFIRQSNSNKRKKRSSLFDLTVQSIRSADNESVPDSELLCGDTPPGRDSKPRRYLLPADEPPATPTSSNALPVASALARQLPYDMGVHLAAAQLQSLRNLAASFGTAIAPTPSLPVTPLNVAFMPAGLSASASALPFPWMHQQPPVAPAFPGYFLPASSTMPFAQVSRAPPSKIHRPVASLPSIYGSLCSGGFV